MLPRWQSWAFFTAFVYASFRALWGLLVASLSHTRNKNVNLLAALSLSTAIYLCFLTFFVLKKNYLSLLWQTISHACCLSYLNAFDQQGEYSGRKPKVSNEPKKKKSHDWGCRVVTWLIVYLQDKRIYSNDLPSWGFRQVGSSIQESTTHACAVTCIYPCNLCPQVPVISPVSDHVFYMKEFRCIRPPVQDSFERKKAKPQDS
jgi:hypothetical protein